MPNAPVVSLRNVSKTFAGGMQALGDCSLEVKDGEFLALLGPSGCGKSTLLRIIAGLTLPSSGEVIWSDNTKTRSSGIGFVFQDPTLMPWTTVAANVSLPLKLASLPASEVETRVETALQQVGLEGFATSYPRELSGGMKMRASIARALVTRPRLLLMDEPFAALDEITRFRLNDDLARLRVEIGCTVIFVTHSVYESVYLSDRILVMAARPGRIIEDIAVDLPPLREEAFRQSQIYLKVAAKASAALRAGMKAEDAL